jgi:hypothetical protein
VAEVAKDAFEDRVPGGFAEIVGRRAQGAIQRGEEAGDELDGVALEAQAIKVGPERFALHRGNRGPVLSRRQHRPEGAIEVEEDRADRHGPV